MQKKSTVYDLPAVIFSRAACRAGIFSRSEVLYNIMKATLVQIIVATLFTSVSIAFNSHGQEILNRKVTLELRDISLMQALARIEQVAGVKFVYSPARIDLSDRVSLDVSREKLGDLLSQLLGPRSIAYSVQERGDYIVLVENVETSSKPSVVETMRSAHVVQGAVSGTVTDEGGNYLPGVNIIVKGTTDGTTTDVDGKYSLAGIKEGAVLIFSFIGFTTREIAVNGRSSINVVLEGVVQRLDEVVVVGYGVTKKGDLTGSIASIDGSSISSQPVSGLNQFLQGRASGVQVTQASNSAGGGLQIRIRGGSSISASNEPLYVIDGFPIPNVSPPAGANHSTSFPNVLASLNPNDIESIEVLKDASATAIYGSRGANGVVLITTKRGKDGAPTVEFHSSYSIARISKKHDMLTASESLKFKNEQLVNLGRPERYGTDPAYGPRQPDDYLPGVDWQDAIYRDAPTQNYNLTVSGGNEKIKYLISGSYFDQDGIVITNNFKRYSARINLDAKLSDRVKLGTSFTTTRSDNNLITEGTSSPIRGALILTPAQRIFDEAGEYSLNFLGMFPTANPIAVLNTSTNELQSDRILGTLFSEIEVVPGLIGRVSVGADILTSRRDVFFTPQTLWANSVGGYGSVGTGLNSNFLNENTLSYAGSISDAHAYDLLVGMTFQKNTEERNYSEAQDFPNYSLGTANLGLANTVLPSSGSINEWGLISYLSRINYRLKDRYLLTLTGRVDGSSRFGVNNKYGFFPSGALAWRVSDEDFLADSKLISDLKLRVSYGITGNDGIGLYNSLSRYSTSRTVFNDQEVLAIQAASLGNSDLKWEKTTQLNVGMDIAVVKSRVQLTADYYVKTTSDLLLTVELPATTGFTSALRNIGSVENRGFELNLNTVNIDQNDFKWSTTGNISFNRNKVLRLADNSDYFITDGIVREGEPLGSFYGAVFDGIWQSHEEIQSAGELALPGTLPGAPKFKDVDGDGVYNRALDRKILGNGLPKAIFGLTNVFSYKGFDLSIFLQGVQGNKIFNATFREILGGDPGKNQLKQYYDGAWRADRPSNTYWSARQWESLTAVSSYYIEDGSFLRIENVGLGYLLPLKSTLIKKARVYVSAQNLAVFTNYRGYDPEVNSDFNSNTMYGRDVFSYPASRSVTIGGNIVF